MKKFFFAMAVMAAMAFVGCSKDDVKQANLVGSWEVYKLWFEEWWDDELDKDWDYEWGIEKEFRMIFSFEEDGTFVQSKHDYYRGNWNTSSYPGTYSISGKKLLLDFGDFQETYTIKSLSSNELVIELKEEEDIYDYYLKRL